MVNRLQNEENQYGDNDSYSSSVKRTSDFFTPTNTDTRKSAKAQHSMSENNFSSMVEASLHKKNRGIKNVKGNRSNASKKSRESFKSNHGAQNQSQGCFKIFKPTVDLGEDRIMDKSIHQQSEFDQSAISVDPSLIR